MNDTKQIVLTALITSLVVGFAVSYWHMNDVEIVSNKFEEESNDIIFDDDYDFEANKEVSDYTFKKIESGSGLNLEMPSIESKDSLSDDKAFYSNSKNGYTVAYPIEWEFQDALTDDYNSTLFGPESSKMGGYFWGISVIKSDELEAKIKETGNQFEDTKETRANVVLASGLAAIIVTVSTEKFDNWLHKSVFIEKDGLLYVISNGATDVDGFEDFYNSFNFTN